MISIIPTCILREVGISGFLSLFSPEARFGRVGTGISEPFGILAIRTGLFSVDYCVWRGKVQFLEAIQ